MSLLKGFDCEAQGVVLGDAFVAVCIIATLTIDFGCKSRMRQIVWATTRTFLRLSDFLKIIDVHSFASMFKCSIGNEIWHKASIGPQSFSANLNRFVIFAADSFLGAAFAFGVFTAAAFLTGVFFAGVFFGAALSVSLESLVDVLTRSFFLGHGHI